MIRLMNTGSNRKAFVLLIFLIILMHISAFGLLILDKDISYSRIILNMEKINEDLLNEKAIIETVKELLASDQEMSSTVNGYDLFVRDEHTLYVSFNDNMLEIIHDNGEILSYDYRY